MTYLAIPGAEQHRAGPNGPITRVVLHATVSPCVAGGARSVARYFQRPDAGGLAHYVIDPAEIVACCPEDVACWHAPPNRGSIGVELTDPQTGRPERWSDPEHRAMLDRAAVLVADLCRRHSLPAVLLDAAGLLAGGRGITTHAAVSQAWHQSDHTDPGAGFPAASFVQLVAQQLDGTHPQEDTTVTPQDRAALVADVVAALDDRVRLILRGDAGQPGGGAHPDNLHTIKADTAAILAKLGG